MPFSDVIGHERTIAQLRAAVRHDRLAHAYLFYGEEAIGKRLVAIRLAQALNCEQPPAGDELDACGRCQACRHIEAHTHPDVYLIEPDQELANPQIKIEQIRALEEHTIYRPLMGLYKVWIIDDAHRMTLGAANALLKTLEEPPGQGLFILVTSRPSALPPTIRSRCQTVRFTPPARTQVEAALILRREMPPAEAHFLAVDTQSRIGAALVADLAATRAQHQELATLVAPNTLHSIHTLLTTVEAFHKAERSTEAIEWLQGWLHDVLLVQVGADTDDLLHTEQLSTLHAMAEDVPQERILASLEQLDAIQRSANRNPNLHLALEATLLHLQRP
jgi:DNA polymerase-3 subunit delta'